METYIALLRGINVSGQKKMPMADLRNMLDTLEFQKVKTYIQSGNIVFDSTENDIDVLEEKIRSRIQSTFGFDVPVLIKSKEEFERILQQNPYTDPEAIEKKQVYFVLLKKAPEMQLAEVFNAESYENEAFFITEACVYLCCKAGYGKAKLDNNRIERKLKVEATTRNFRTMVKLLEMATK